MIYLVIVTHDNPQQYEEYHIRFEGHQSLDSARKEIDEIRRRLIKDGKKPLDCYIYEANAPLYGCREYTLDEIDFNFYKVPTEEELRKIQSVEQAYFKEMLTYVK